jgi:hypothetical protein
MKIKQDKKSILIVKNTWENVLRKKWTSQMTGSPVERF